MSLTKLHYVFSFLFISIICLSEPVFAQETGNIEKGSATWYGSKYHGRRTTSGEIYNKNRMTAAHPSLPFGTKVKVTNLTNNKTVIVRITDRGPFGNKGHIIDLSEAAARKIGIFNAGYRNVTVEKVSGEDLGATEVIANSKPVLAPVATDTAEKSPVISNLPYFIVQAGAFAEQSNAQLQSDKIKAIEQNLPIMLREELVNGKKIHRVVAGKFASRAEAEEMKIKLGKKGFVVLVKQIPAAS